MKRIKTNRDTTGKEPTMTRRHKADQWDRANKFVPLNVPKKLAVLLNQSKKPMIDIKKPVEHGFYIYGDVGIGKSYQACCILNEISKLYMKRGSFWVNVPKLLNDIKMSFYDRESENLIDKYSRAFLICLDDLGAEQDTQWVMQTLYLIINYRYENLLPTIITSNLSLIELSSKFNDDRLTSRIRGMCKPLKMNGKDLRTI